MTDRGPPHDHRREVTDRVIKLLEDGTAPWLKPWKDAPLHLPVNPTTGKNYRGGNVFGLLIDSMERGYIDPRFCTYRQAAEKGWQVRKGEKGMRIEFWEVKPGRAGPDDGDDDKPHSRLIHRTYTVFNGQQIDGIPPFAIEPRKPFEIIEAGERILTDSGADIRHGGSKAFYRPSTDHIQLPPKDAFVDEPAYYGTACHELAHWTGHKSRLNRLADEHRFGTPEYAKEEIRADMAALYLCAETGIPTNPEQTAGYVSTWLDVLKQDKHEFFRAAADAATITDYLQQRTKDRAPASHVARLEERASQQARSL